MFLMIKTLEDLHKKAVVEKCFLENQVVVDVSTAFGRQEDIKHFPMNWLGYSRSNH